MDFLTAGVALSATLFCVALVMAGICIAAPEEACTRYWAAAEGLLAVGVLLLSTHAGDSRLYPARGLGNDAVIAGAVLQWWGAQAFFREPRGSAGWVIVATYALLHAALAIAGASLQVRLLAFSGALLSILGLTLHTFLRHASARPTFGHRIVSGAIGLLIANNLLRIAIVSTGGIELGPASAASSGVIVMYLIPLTGVLLYATGVLVLYFERTVSEKHHLATHDELTGLLNRRALLAAGEREIALAQRARGPVAVAMLDIDHFKDVNDRLGHDAGDRVLQDIAVLLKRCCRGIDLVGRHGGEEFCLILPAVGLARCGPIGERLMQAVRDYRYRGEYPVTVSAGFAVFDPVHAPESWQELVRRADAQLYKAKDAGRDRYCIACAAHEEWAAPEPALPQPGPITGLIDAATHHSAVQ